MEKQVFVLERTENPHPVMLAGALAARDGDDTSYWRGYLQAMCDATGESAEDIVAWMDRVK